MYVYQWVSACISSLTRGLNTSAPNTDQEVHIGASMLSELCLFGWALAYLTLSKHTVMLGIAVINQLSYPLSRGD